MLNIVSVESDNSTDFLEKVFECYRAEQLFAVSRPDTQLSGRGIFVRHVASPDVAKHGWSRPDYRPRFSDAPAQIIFSSGTEGAPKPIVLSQRNLADVVNRLNDFMQVTGEIREYIGVPVTYSFGLGRARAVAAAGGACYLPERFDPSEICAMFSAGEINAVSAVPSLWKAVLSAPESFRAVGALVRWIEIGSQYMSGADKAEMKRLFPNARIVQHYGLTEASRTTLLDISSGDSDALESVGVTTGTVEIRSNDEGAICIRGPHVALGYLAADGAISPLTDAEGWLVTKDCGEIRDGRLYFLGRLDDQINVSGIKISPDALERDIAGRIPGLEGAFAITSLPDRMRGEIVLLAIADAAGDHAEALENAAKAALERHGIKPVGALRALRLAALPRTGTDKIQRRALRDLCAEQIQSSAAPAQAGTGRSATLTPAEDAVAATWRKVMGGVDISPTETFYDVGGDSLSSVQIGLVMESTGFRRRAIHATLEGKPLSEVARLTEAAADGDETPGPVSPAGEISRQTAKSWAVSFTRGIMVLSVLLSHWGDGLFGRFGLADQFERVLAIIYRMGTPGFATVFGIGIGAFILPGFADKRATMLKRMRLIFWLVFSGLALSAATTLILSAMRNEAIDGRHVSYAFYNVLAYYAVAFGLAPLWMPLLARLRTPIVALPILAVVMWIVGLLAAEIIPSDPQESLLEWPRLMSIAGYNIFKMSSIALLGIAAGQWLAAQTDLRRTTRRLLAIGALGGAICVFSLVRIYGYDAFSSRGSPAFGSPAGIMLYFSLALLMVGAFMAVARIWNGMPALCRRILLIFIVFGGLALPIYAFHAIVVPVRDILVLLGMSAGPALALPMGIFLSGIGYAGWRLHRMYAG